MYELPLCMELSLCKSRAEQIQQAQNYLLSGTIQKKFANTQPRQSWHMFFKKKKGGKKKKEGKSRRLRPE